MRISILGSFRITELVRMSAYIYILKSFKSDKSRVNYERFIFSQSKTYIWSIGKLCFVIAILIFVFQFNTILEKIT